MTGKVVNSSFVLLRKFGASRQESASKTATSYIRKTFINNFLEDSIERIQHLYISDFLLKDDLLN